jgi:peptidoglycan hydrolase-like protein with peptidoglycan-binding domain
MVKVITIIYILCSVYASGSDTASPAFSQQVSSLMQYNLMQNALQEYEAMPVEQIDYLDALKLLGFLKEDDSNNKELNTRNSVIRFQSECNMAIDGIWGPRCMNALEKRLSEEAMTYPDTVEEPPSDKEWIVINKSKRILTLYKGDKAEKKYPVAVGNPPSLTPEGKYKIVSKVVNPIWGGGGYAKPVKGGSLKNPLGFRWMGLSYKDGNELGIHGNNSPFSIGRNISHGCIRMINTDVEELFEKVSKSAEVWIGTEKELEKWGVSQPQYNG